MSAGFTYRMGRIFGGPNGHAVIIPVDHGTVLGAVQGLEDAVGVLKRLIDADIDGTLLGLGMARQTADLFATRTSPARILTVDLPLQSNVPGEMDEIRAYDVIASVEDALQLGFDAVKTMLVWGVEHELQMHMLARIAEIREACNRWDMPLMIEPVLWGSAIPESEKNDPRRITHACRICVELGADILKAPFIADEDALRSLVQQTPVPVVILGGAKTPNLADVLAMAEQATRVGVRGIVFGRNVWQREDPTGIVAALRKVVHEGRPASEVMAVGAEAS